MIAVCLTLKFPFHSNRTNQMSALWSPDLLSVCSYTLLIGRNLFSPENTRHFEKPLALISLCKRKVD